MKAEAKRIQSLPPYLFARIEKKIDALKEQGVDVVFVTGDAFAQAELVAAAGGPANLKDVYYSAGEISQQDLVEQISNIKDGRTNMDLLFGCLVDWGVPLSLPIKTETIENLQVYNVNDGDLVACFADDIPEAAIRQIAAAKPLRAVFRDSSFKSDSAKINVTEIFKTISPNTTVKVV